MSEKQEKVVDLTERTTVYATDKNKHKKTGEPMHVSVLAVDHLIDKGFATKEKPSKSNK